ncbi:unnamed protein product [Phytomonas sp. Hart1]|nr:unnamed protein product [Phytomonas sp. Hart1]|eukprot:CCW66373.1 unnamed protein product [Phytomonas sp. isolate Hart1]
MSMILPIVRDVAVDWASLVKGAFEEIHISVPRSVEDSLMALNTYAKLPPSAFSHLTTGLKDACVYCALLTSLDQSITEWPVALQRRMSAASIQRGGSKITTCRPLVEAVIVLYNAAVANLEGGMSNLARIHADASQRHPAMDTRTTVHPNVNAKNAYRHFQYAHVLSIDVMGFLFPLLECDGAVTRPTLSIYETVQLKSLLEVEELQALVSLCIAVAKYVFALNDSIGEKLDVLAKLAFAGASLQIPELTARGFPEIRLLPSFLLVAYHCHQAEYYYKVTPKLPDMARALGHISYADEILCGIDKKIKSGNFQKDDWNDGSKVAKMTLSLGKLLWRKFVGDRSKKETNGPEGRYLIEEMESDNEISHRASVYNNILRFLSENECSLVRILPATVSIVRRVYELYKQYHHENLAVYLTKPLPTDIIKLDSPDSAVVELSLNIPGIESSRTSPFTSFLHHNTFKDMPQEQEVNVAYSKKEVVKAQEDSMLEQCMVIENIVDELRAVQLPHEVRLCIEAMEPCLENHIGSVAAALQIAERTLHEAWKWHEEAVQLWMDTRKKCLAMRGVMGLHERTLEAQKELEEWCKNLKDAESDWLRFIGPLDFGADIEKLIRLLLPGDCRGTREYILQAEGVVAETRRTLQTASIPIAGTRRITAPELSSFQTVQMENTQANLRKLASQGERLLARLREVMEQSNWWEKRQAAMRCVVLVIWSAPELKNKLAGATQLLQDECAKLNNAPSDFGRHVGLDIATNANVDRDLTPWKRRSKVSSTHESSNDTLCFGNFVDKKRHRSEETSSSHAGEGVSSTGAQSTMTSMGIKTTNESLSSMEAKVSNSLKNRLRKNREAL